MPGWMNILDIQRTELNLKILITSETEPAPVIEPENLNAKL